MSMSKNIEKEPEPAVVPPYENVPKESIRLTVRILNLNEWKTNPRLCHLSYLEMSNSNVEGVTDQKKDLTKIELYKTEAYSGLEEYRFIAASILEKEESYELEVKETINDVSHGVLYSVCNTSCSVNRVIYIEFIKSLKGPSPLQIGIAVEGALISDARPNGQIYVNLSEYIGYKIFKDYETAEASTYQNKYEEIKSRSINKHKLDKAVMYLSMYSDSCYRCKIIELPTSKEDLNVVVHYIDYGNTEKVHLNDLVCCSLVDEALEAFPFQAVSAFLANVKTLNTEEFFKHVSEKKRFDLLVYEDAGENSPVVGLFRNEFPVDLKHGPRSFNLIADLKEANIVTLWTERKLFEIEPLISLPVITPTRLNLSIDAWFEEQGTFSVSPGAILDLKIGKVVTPHQIAVLAPVDNLRNISLLLEKDREWDFMYKDRRTYETDFLLRNLRNEIKTGNDIFVLKQSIVDKVAYSANDIKISRNNTSIESAFYKRVRVLDEAPDEKTREIKVHLLDTNVISFAKVDELRPLLNHNLLEIPLQAANLKLRPCAGFIKLNKNELKAFCELIEFKRAFVKVFTIHKSALGVTEIIGDIYSPFAIHNSDQNQISENEIRKLPYKSYSADDVVTGNITLSQEFKFNWSLVFPSIPWPTIPNFDESTQK